MIYIESLKFKNIRSVGNVEFNIDFNQGKNFLFVGNNGSGKTTVLEALTFSMFGKPFSKISISELINDINNHLETTLCFRTDKNNYRICRNLKPDLLEIYENDVLVPRPGNKEDYQNILNKLYGFDYKIFKISILHGSATYIPFMELDAKSRREFTEKLLDLEVISVMSDIIKKDLKQHKDKVKLCDDQIYKTEVNLNGLEQSKKLDDDRRKQGIDDIVLKINELEQKKSVLDQTYQEQNRLYKSVSIDKYKETREKLNQNIRDLERKINEIKTGNRINQKKIDSIKNRDICPECLQKIDDGHKSMIIESNPILKYSEIESELNQIQSKFQKNENALEKIRNKETEIREIHNKIQGIETQIKMYHNEIQRINEVKEYPDIDRYKSELITLKNKRDDLYNEQKIKEMSVLFLKDDGIKTDIISRYLPVINQSINKYLKQFGLFMRFELSPEFEEVFKSRHVQKRSYNSFSEGEKKRIDFAILFAFVEVSSQKHKIMCNFMAFDEIFEKLDDDGIEAIITILRNNNKTNLLITHEQELINSFNGSRDRVITATKKGNFTNYKFLN